MKPYKAPDPDGFHCIFFKQYWHIVGDDIFKMVQSAFQTCYFDPEISNTLIALIPKIDPPTTYKDFRPISLCNIVYKIITKVLVHRLRLILTNIIGPYQSSFLPGRGTSDNSIVLQEIIHYMKRSKRKKGFVAFKLDLEKAFDNVNWDFLSIFLHDFGFPDITIKLIMHCVSSSTTLSYGMETSCHISSQLTVSDKVTLCPPISSFFAWRSFLFLSTPPSTKEVGKLFKSPIEGPRYLTSSLQMMSSYSLKRRVLSSISFTTSLKDSAELLG
jgi:hypothetical protein